MHVGIRLRRTDGPDPPYDHNYLLGSAIYNRLQKFSSDGADALHDSSQRGPYVVSEIHRVRGKSKEAWFRVGTTNTAVLNLLTQAFAPGTDLRVGPAYFDVKELDVEEPPANPGRFVTLSPILLRDPDSHQGLVHDSPGYHASLQGAINGQILNHLGEASSVAVQRITPQAVRKRTVDGGTYLTQKAHIHLQGSTDHLAFLVNHGIGSSPALGFGMIVRDRATAGPEPPGEDS